MWLADWAAFLQRHKLKDKQALQHRCTAEHLVAKSEGGLDRPSNIVAACHYCNRHRHMSKLPLAPDRYRVMVRRRLTAGKWHGFVSLAAAQSGLKR